ncbi:uncharacterized protein RJT20DRAFT_128996 [Scheffersomyces xylosifermentans]|uniref:uncharacterized protein n=1 Tax=Scheffersomyces xylosifermentans TaxID=1304137 RepID=UPI00315D5A28
MLLSLDQYLIRKSSASPMVKQKSLTAQKSPDPIGFLDLPAEILHLIVFYLSDGELTFNHSFLNPLTENYPENTYILNHIRCGHKVYSSFLALSSTCTVLRGLLGPLLFRNLSLVRENQIDTLMANPKVQQMYSDKKVYHRAFIKELMATNFDNCSKEELAKSSFKISVIGDSQYKSFYQKTLSINNFVTYLECDNLSLLNYDLDLFPHLKSLKIFDSGLVQPSNPLDGDSRVSIYGNLRHLESFSIHSNTLVLVPELQTIFYQLKRLDIVIEFNELAAVDGMYRLKQYFSKPNGNLRELNLFIDNRNALEFEEMSDLMREVGNNCFALSSLNIRKIRRKSHSDGGSTWIINEDEFGGNNLTKVLSKMRNLQNFGIDLSILDSIMFSSNVTNLNPSYQEFDAERIHDVRCLTIIEPSLNTPKLSDKLRNVISFLARSLNVTELRCQYGEVVEQAHIQALNLVTNLVEFLSNPFYNVTYYHGLNKVSIEKCWSVTDDSINRDYYDNAIMDTVRVVSRPLNLFYSKLKLASATVWGRTTFNSPRYRVRETFEVRYTKITLGEYLQSLEHPPAEIGSRYYYTEEMQKLMTRPTYKNGQDGDNEYTNSRAFWSVEASLSELEQYSLKQKKASGIWDT